MGLFKRLISVLKRNPAAGRLWDRKKALRVGTGILERHGGIVADAYELPLGTPHDNSGAPILAYSKAKRRRRPVKLGIRNPGREIGCLCCVDRLSRPAASGD
jgi:hypothetical protein